MSTDTVQFSGEDSWTAVVNGNSLNIEEERDFSEFCLENNVDISDVGLEALTEVYVRWVQESGMDEY